MGYPNRGRRVVDDRTPAQQKASGLAVRDAIRKSRDEWRAMQGLPPIDYSKKEDTSGNSEAVK